MTVKPDPYINIYTYIGLELIIKIQLQKHEMSLK